MLPITGKGKPFAGPGSHLIQGGRAPGHISPAPREKWSVRCREQSSQERRAARNILPDKKTPYEQRDESSREGQLAKHLFYAEWRRFS